MSALLHRQQRVLPVLLRSKWNRGLCLTHVCEENSAPRSATRPVLWNTAGPIPRNAAGPVPQSTSTGTMPRSATSPIPESAASAVSWSAAGPVPDVEVDADVDQGAGGGVLGARGLRRGLCG